MLNSAGADLQETSREIVKVEYPDLRVHLEFNCWGADFYLSPRQRKECAEEDQQPDDLAVISYLIYFSPDGSFG